MVNPFARSLAGLNMSHFKKLSFTGKVQMPGRAWAVLSRLFRLSFAWLVAALQKVRFIMMRFSVPLVAVKEFKGIEAFI